MDVPTPPPLFRPQRPRPWVSIGRAIAWQRRPLAVLAAMAAVLCLAAALDPTSEPTVPVVVAARPIAGGRVLTDSDLRIAHYPRELAPGDSVADPAQLTGRMVITNAVSGSPLGEQSVVAPRVSATAAGRVLLPLRLDDPAIAALLRVGDVVDILSVGPPSAADNGASEATPLASGARILALPAADASSPLGIPSGGSDRLILVEVPSASVSALVAAQSRERLTVVIR